MSLVQTGFLGDCPAHSSGHAAAQHCPQVAAGSITSMENAKLIFSHTTIKCSWLTRRDCSFLFSGTFLLAAPAGNQSIGKPVADVTTCSKIELTLGSETPGGGACK